MRSFARAVLPLVLLAACTGGTEGGAHPRGAAPTPAPTGPASTPTGPAEEPSSLVWVAVEDGRELVLVDAARREVVRRVPVPGPPHNVVVSDDGTVAATLQETGRVAVTRGRDVTRLDLGGSPHDVKAAGDLLVVANEGAARLDLVWPEREYRVASVPLKAPPHDVAIAPGGARAWVTLNDSDELAVVDLEGREVVRYVPTGRRPHDLLFDHEGGLWITDWGGDLHVRRRGLLTTLSVGEETHHLAFTPDGEQAWITDHEGEQVVVVGTRSLRVLRRVSLDGEPHHVAITDAGWAVVANHARGVVEVFRALSGRRVGEIAVGPGPHGVWAVR